MFDREQTVCQPTVRRMADAIAHRGPDDEGFYFSEQIGLGFRRLSIIDIKGGHQPLSNETGTIWIVFNGEVYNYQALRKQLVAKGHIFKTNTDTEVIVHLYEEYGSDCVHKLRGMFAFAIWDSAQRSLLLARDRVGIKPLYYYVGRNFLSFGSEMKALLADKEVRREVDPPLIDRFLTYYYLPGSQTLLKNLFKLEPGHILLARDGRHEMRRYWDLDFSDGRNDAPQAALERELIDLLDETVGLHMISDVPLGLLLSGGLDSTAMLSFAARKANQPVNTFTIGFSSKTVVDERPFARLAAAHYGAKHHELSITPVEFASFLPSYIWHMEEPVCQPPAIALYFVSRLAKEYVKVLISGEGGDEAFAGYENYRNLFWFESLRSLCGPLQKPVGACLFGVGRLLKSRRLTKYGARLDCRFEDYYLSRTSSPFEFFPRESRSFYSDRLMERSDRQSSIEITRRYLQRAANYPILNKMLYVDTKTWLPDELLIKADKMTMANSIELRVPLLDHKMLEFAAQLPRNQKVRGLTMKYLAKKALRGRVPDSILDRPKAGFPIPYQTWLRNELGKWASDILLDGRTSARGYFRRDAVEKLVSRSVDGVDYSKEVFSLVALELWHRAFADDDGTLKKTDALPSRVSSQSVGQQVTA